MSSSSNRRILQLIAYVMIAAIFVFAMSISRSCSGIKQAGVEGFSKGDTIDIALLYTPGGFYMSGDTLEGINYDIASLFSDSTSTPIKIWPVSNLSDALLKLEKGAFDILASLPLNNSLKKQFPVSESIYLDKLVLIQLSDSASGMTPVNSSIDLNGKTVHVMANSSAAARMKNLSEEIGGKIEIFEEPELSEELIALKVANGSIPLGVVNEKVAIPLSEIYPNLKYDSTISFTQFQVWVFNPNDTLIFNSFNDWFDTFRKTENYRAIIDKY